MGLGSLSFLKYKSISAEQKLEITVLKAEVKTKEQTIVELQNELDAKKESPEQETAPEIPAQLPEEQENSETVDVNQERIEEYEIISQFLVALYETKSNNLTTQFEAISPYLRGEALEAFVPSEENVISNDDGYSNTTISDIRLYRQDISETQKEMVVFFTMTQDILDPPIVSNMVMTLLLEQQDGVWKISVIYENKGY